MTDLADNRTETQRLEDNLDHTLRRIRTLWPDATSTLIPGRRLSSGSRGGGLIAADDATTDADIDPVTRAVSIRRNTIDVLTPWCRVIIEDRPITNPASIPRRDVDSMCLFLEIHAQWFSGHDMAPEALDELRTIANQLATIQPPTMSVETYLETRPPLRWFLGRCPLTKNTNDAQPQPETEPTPADICNGHVYAYPDDEEGRGDADYTRRRDPWAICDKCHEKAVASHWEKRIFADKAALEGGYMDRLVGIDDIIRIAASEFGRHISKQTVWQWVSRSKIAPIDRDKKPHQFKLIDVIDTLTAREAG